MARSISDRTIEKLLRQQAALAAFGSFAVREPDLLLVLTEATRICAACLDVPFAKVCRYRAEKDYLLIVAGWGWHPGVFGRVVSQADESSPQGRAYVTGKPVIMRDLQTVDGMAPPAFYAEHGIVSTIDVVIPAHRRHGLWRAGKRQHPPAPVRCARHQLPDRLFANVVAESFDAATRVKALREGTIAVTLTPAGPAAATLTLEDDGVGFDVGVGSSRHGLGLVRRLVEPIGGTLDIRSSDGTVCRSGFPVPGTFDGSKAAA